MGRRAYYNFEADFLNRDIKVMAEELNEGNVPFHLTEDSIRVGDRTLIKHKNERNIEYWRYSSWGDPIFNSYNHALRWLIADKPDLDVSEHGEIVTKKGGFSLAVREPKITFDCIYDQSPIYKPSEREIDFAYRHEDPNRILARIIPAIKRIEINTKKGVVYTTVIWNDGSKPTVVKKSEDDPHDLYFAVASAIAIKVYGSNSAFKREIEEKLEDITEGTISWIKPI